MIDLPLMLAFIAAASLLTVTPGVDTAIVLREVEGLSYEEIAEAMEVPRSPCSARHTQLANCSGRLRLKP